MTISIVKGTEGIVALISSIGTKQSDYRNAVSSALLSSVAHSIEHGETSTVKKLLDEIFTVSYRDLKVLKLFIESVTPILLKEEKEGRRTRLVIHEKQFMDKDYSNEGTAKTIGENKLKAAKKHNGRAILFETFATENGEMQVRNLDWKEGDAKENKTVGVQYHCDVFKWYEDVEYIRKAVTDAADAEAINPFEALVKDAYENAVTPISAAIKALESLKGDDRTEQVVNDLTVLQGIYNRLSTHVKQREDERVIATEVKSLEKIGAAKGEITKWVKQREKRVAEGKEADAIAAEFKQYFDGLKAKKAEAAKASEDEKAAA